MRFSFCGLHPSGPKERLYWNNIHTYICVHTYIDTKAAKVIHSASKDHWEQQHKNAKPRDATPMLWPRGLAHAPHSRSAWGSSTGAAAWHERRRRQVLNDRFDCSICLWEKETEVGVG